MKLSVLNCSIIITKKCVFVEKRLKNQVNKGIVDIHFATGKKE